jgi:hypothetical protein
VTRVWYERTKTLDRTASFVFIVENEWSRFCEVYQIASRHIPEGINIWIVFYFCCEYEVRRSHSLRDAWRYWL